jgi:hypothetical protein
MAECPRSLRGQRGAHIHLKCPIPHPLFAQGELDDIPVLPADYCESRAGQPMASVYEQIRSTFAPASLRLSVTRNRLPV